MRIAVVVGSFPELSQTFILDQITGLIDRGHDVQVFGRVPEREQPLHAAFETYRLQERTHHWWGSADVREATRRRTRALLREAPWQNGRVLLRAHNVLARGTLTGRYWSYAACMREQGAFDVVLAQFGVNGRIAETLRGMGAFDAPIATTWLGYDLSRVVREHGAGYYRRLFAHGELMLPLSEEFAARLRKLGCPSDKLRIHRLGVDSRRFAFAERALGPGETPRIVTVCRLVEKKGLAFALQALAEVAKRGARFEYHVVGDGPERSRLERLCDELGLRERTTFFGARSREEVQATLARGHLFLSPSVVASDGDEEGTPTAIIEAMAVGMPVISTFHSGIPEVVSDGVSGYLARERDVPQLAEHLQRVLAEPDAWPRMGRAGREIVEAKFDAAKLNDDLANILSTLAARSRTA